METLKDAENITLCVNALKHRLPAVRLNAIRALGRLRVDPAVVVPLLTRVAEDRDELVRRAAVEILGKVGPESVAALTVALASADHQVRRLAVSALARLGTGAKKAVPALIQALRDLDASVRRQAARTLGLLGPAARPAIPALTEALGDADVVCCRLAAWALIQPGPGGIAALEQALFSGDEHICREAIWALGQAGARARPAVPALAALLSPHFQAPGATEHEQVGAAAALPATAVIVIEPYRKPRSAVRLRAIRALAQIGREVAEARLVLAAATQDRDARVRQWAAAALEKVDPDLDQENDCTGTLAYRDLRRRHASPAATTPPPLPAALADSA
jgi:HEAT repeat protein